jgi:hypothetical protein
MNEERKQQWVICHYFPHEPMEIYGVFDSEKEAIEYTERLEGELYSEAYSAHCIRIRDVKEQLI